MEGVRPDVEGHAADLDEIPSAQVFALHKNDATLANSIRSLVDAGQRSAQDFVAFNNYL
jgi:hypothetical protein